MVPPSSFCLWSSIACSMPWCLPSSEPRMLNVLPALVCPYANTVPLMPFIAPCTMRLPTREYTSAVVHCLSNTLSNWNWLLRPDSGWPSLALYACAILGWRRSASAAFQTCARAKSSEPVLARQAWAGNHASVAFNR